MRTSEMTCEPVTGFELMELKDHQCRYPVVSEGKHHLFCGLPSRGSWCEKHLDVITGAEWKRSLSGGLRPFRRR